MLDSSMIKKTAAESKTKGMKLNPHATSKVNGCQEMVTGVLFGLNTQFINMLWHWIQFLKVGTNLNCAKVNTVPCMFTAPLSLSLSL